MGEIGGLDSRERTVAIAFAGESTSEEVANCFAVTVGLAKKLLLQRDR